MCGIAGLWGCKKVSDVSDDAIVQRMAGSIAHRGPDDHGTWHDPDAGVAIAHRRLAIVDLSPTGHQPMVSECGRYVIAFNGEIYNHAKIRREIGDAIQWRGKSDTEVLLSAIATWGIRRALEACVGMFAHALWDRQERTLTLARDRMGEKPLYYGRVGSTFVFASELAAIRAHPSWQGEIDRQSLALLMRHNYIPAPYSIFRGIAKLMPGHFLVLDGATVEPRVECYWNAGEAARSGAAAPFEGSASDAVDALEGLIRQSLEGQMMADVPLGAFLSGGIDSSAVVALMQSMSAKPIQSFTIGFHQDAFNEARHARAVAEHLGTDHTELFVTEQDARDVIPLLPQIYSEPFADSSQIPTYLVSRLARRNVTVSLSGDGGDELFAGYTRYSLAQRLWGRLKNIPPPLRGSLAALAAMAPLGFLTPSPLPQTPCFPRARNWSVLATAC